MGRRESIHSTTGFSKDVREPEAIVLSSVRF
jgi:hypothetical protein